MIDSISNNVAQRLKNKNQELPKEQQVVVDPATILLISNMVNGIINAIRACRAKRQQTEEQTVSIINKPDKTQIRLVKRIVRKELGWWKNLWHGRKFVSAILAEGTELSKEQIEEAIQEQQNTI